MNSFAYVLMLYHSLWARVILCAHYNIHHTAKQQKLVSHLQGLDNYLTSHFVNNQYVTFLSNFCGGNSEVTGLLAEYMIRRLSIVI